MGHLVRVRVGYGSVRAGYGSVRVNQFLVEYAHHAKTSNFVENFGRVWFGFGQFEFWIYFRMSIFRM